MHQCRLVCRMGNRLAAARLAPRKAKPPAGLGAGLWLVLLVAGLFLALTRAEAGPGSPLAVAENLSGRLAGGAIEAACPADCASERPSVPAGFDGGEEASALAALATPAGYPAPRGPVAVSASPVEALAASFSARAPPSRA